MEYFHIFIMFIFVFFSEIVVESRLIGLALVLAVSDHDRYVVNKVISEEKWVGYAGRNSIYSDKVRAVFQATQYA